MPFEIQKLNKNSWENLVRYNLDDGKPVKNNNENLRVSISDAFDLQYREEQTIQPKLLYWQPNEFSPIKLYTIFNK